MTILLFSGIFSKLCRIMKKKWKEPSLLRFLFRSSWSHPVVKTLWAMWNVRLGSYPSVHRFNPSSTRTAMFRVVTDSWTKHLFSCSHINRSIQQSSTEIFFLPSSTSHHFPCRASILSYPMHTWCRIPWSTSSSAGSTRAGKIIDNWQFFRTLPTKCTEHRCPIQPLSECSDFSVRMYQGQRLPLNL